MNTTFGGAAPMGAPVKANTSAKQKQRVMQCKQRDGMRLASKPNEPLERLYTLPEQTLLMPLADQGSEGGDAGIISVFGPDHDQRNAVARMQR